MVVKSCRASGTHGFDRWRGVRQGAPCNRDKECTSHTLLTLPIPKLKLSGVSHSSRSRIHSRAVTRHRAPVNRQQHGSNTQPSEMRKSETAQHGARFIDNGGRSAHPDIHGLFAGTLMSTWSWSANKLHPPPTPWNIDHPRHPDVLLQASQHSASVTLDPTRVLSGVEPLRHFLKFMIL